MIQPKFVGIVMVSLLGGCSTAAVTATPGIDASSPVEAGAPTSELPDAGAIAADAGNEDAEPIDAGVAPTEESIGAVTLVSEVTSVDGGVHSSYRAGAFFVKRPLPRPGAPPQTMGPCVVQTLDPNDDGADEQIVSAGAIQIAGGSAPIDLAPSGKGDYAAVTSPTALLWNGGETLTATAAGDGVPGFTVSLTAPSKVTVTAPALPQGGAASLSVPRNAPFSATWTGATSGRVILYFDGASATKATTVTCSYMASDGMGQVPAAALAALPAGSGSFNFYVLEKAAAPPAGWKINFAASASMRDPGGRSAVGPASVL